MRECKEQSAEYRFYSGHSTESNCIDYINLYSAR